MMMHAQALLHMKQTPSAKNDPILGRCKLPGCHNTGCNQKCGICRTAHYCGSVHQRRDWNRHKSECQPVQPRLREDIALALPQLACAHNWINWYQEYAPNECDLVVTNAALGEDRPDNSVLSIIIMTRDNYKKEWGQKQLQNSPKLWLSMADRHYVLCVCSIAHDNNEDYSETMAAPPLVGLPIFLEFQSIRPIGPIHLPRQFSSCDVHR